MASVLPTGTVLESLTLDDSAFGSGRAIDLKILSESGDIEPTIKQNFQSNSMFSDYKLISTTANDGDSIKYKNIISISVIFNKVTTQ